MNESGKKALLDMSEISLALDTYDDIFSGFDPRPYGQRAISQDFLAEMKRATKDTISGAVEIRFMVPEKIRNKDNEVVIKKRVRDHFKKHHGLIHEEKNKILIQGSIFISISIFIMLFTAIFFFEKIGTDLLSRFIFILLEPAGWFLFWEGLNLMIFESRKKDPDILFYDKVSKAEIEFMGY